MDVTSGLSISIHHDPRLVALSVVMACLGGYVGLGLAAKIQSAVGIRRRGLLAGAAWSVALGIWTMHFVGMLAAKLPADVLYSVLPTLLSFLMCVLVVGIGIFLASTEQARALRITLAGLFMGAGIVTMHYLGISALSGHFMIHHNHLLMAASAIIAVVTSTSALTLFALDHRPLPLAISAMLFGLAVSGMHYTAMAGMSLQPSEEMTMFFGPVVAGEDLAIVIAILGFVVSGGFLLFLVPEREAPGPKSFAAKDVSSSQAFAPTTETGEALRSIPMQQAGNGAQADRSADWDGAASSVPVESEGVTRLIPVELVRSVQANAHYTLIFDGQREHFSPWSITEAQRRLGNQRFMRVHRSYLVSVDHVRSLRKSGDGGVVEVESALARSIPVSRSHYAELKARLRTPIRSRSAVPIHQ